MKKIVNIVLFLSFMTTVAWSSPRIDYATFITMEPHQQAQVVNLLMKSYATFEEAQRRLISFVNWL